MSEYLSYDFLVGSQPLPNIDYYTKQQPQQSPQQQQQQTQPFDFDFASYVESCGPSQDIQEFENDLDALAFDANLDAALPVIVDNSAVFASIRTGTPTRGVPSNFTLSSDSASAYDSTGYNETDSVYTYHSQSDLSVLYEQLNTMNFQSLGVVDSDASVYSAPSPISPHSSPNSNIGMPVSSYSPSSFSHRGSFSDYEPARMRVPPSSTSDYYPHVPIPVKYSSPVMQATVSPANVSTQLPNVQPMQSAVVASHQQQEAQDNHLSRSGTSKDSKRKYLCPSCPRCNYLLSHFRFTLIDHVSSCSICSCIQSQDAHPDSRPEPLETIRLSSQVLW